MKIDGLIYIWIALKAWKLCYVLVHYKQQNGEKTKVNKSLILLAKVRKEMENHLLFLVLFFYFRFHRKEKTSHWKKNAYKLKVVSNEP